MRVIFMGTPEFAVPACVEISRRGFELAAVYSREPARGGRRGLEIRKAPVHEAADSLGVPVFTPRTLRDAEVQRAFRELAADVAVVAAYGLILPVPILAATKLGCLNLHGSLLPRWRGAAPIQRAIMAGDKETGVDVMRMEAGLDTGPVGLREIIPIRPDDTAGDLTRRLSAIAARLAVSALEALVAGRLTFEPQPPDGASYARKIEKSEAEIDWTQAAEAVRNQIHGLSPAPGAFSRVVIGDREESVKLFRAEVADGEGPPGTLLSDDMRIACGSGAIRVLEGQRAGRTAMGGGEFMRGAKLGPGATFGRAGEPSIAKH
ncbi:MAG TPA: methionyl-tRNA formyltransferase [Roseiarcus sp.]|jgi:methionyl-tRNA formyltransferase